MPNSGTMRLPGDPPEIVGTVTKLRRLADDLEAASAGRLPSAAVLSDTLVLDHRRFSLRASVCLVGVRARHPVLPGDGRETVTSDLYFPDVGAGVARTVSRWHAPGRRPGDGGTVSQASDGGVR